jgi:NAD-dependent SIR2 family protein deacetylase
MIHEERIRLGDAARCLQSVKTAGGGLLVLTGAGMSVSSGVPVFRGSDGSMSPDFLRFLGGYNAARKKAGLRQADDWFSFSVPEMFGKETAAEAWQYWRWRMLRALVKPAADYEALMQIVDYFGRDKVFVQTSNCDMLHERAGMSADAVFEIHGSLGRLQCSDKCCETLYTVDTVFLTRLEQEPDWVPQCSKCSSCLRPNVMIFGDGTLVHSEIRRQEANLRQFKKRFEDDSKKKSSLRKGNWVVLEVGAGTVVPSIRFEAEGLAARADETAGGGLVRINPSADECTKMQTRYNECQTRKYYPLVQRSTEALSALANELSL